MKAIIWMIVSAMLLATTSCKKGSDKEEELYRNVPNSKVPDELASGTWFYGTLSAISFYDRYGHNLGNEYEAGREFQFSNQDGKGRVKFWQYLGMKTYSTCVTEIYTRKEGSIVFNGKTFTFYPVKGSFKTIKDKCSSGNGVNERPAEADDLSPETFRWEIRIIEGVKHLYTFAEDDVNLSNPLFVYTYATIDQ